MRLIHGLIHQIEQGIHVLALHEILLHWRREWCIARNIASRLRKLLPRLHCVDGVKQVSFHEILGIGDGMNILRILRALRRLGILIHGMLGHIATHVIHCTEAAQRAQVSMHIAHAV